MKFCKNQYLQKTHTVVRFCIKNSCIACVFVSKHTCVAISCNLQKKFAVNAFAQLLKENTAKTPMLQKTHTVVRFCIKNGCIACVFVSKIYLRCH